MSNNQVSGLHRLFGGMRIAASGLRAERTRMDVISRNIANANTTSTEQGGPYRRQVAHFEPILERLAGGQSEVAGVRVKGVEGDFATPFEEFYDPSHPDRDANGMVSMPNVVTVREMADLITAVRAYEANLSVQESFEKMAERTLRLAD